MRIRLRPLDLIFSDYCHFHGHPVNLLIHKIAVPLIFWSLFGLLACLPFPFLNEATLFMNWATLVMAVSLFYFAYYGKLVFSFMIVFYGLVLLLLYQVQQLSASPFQVFLGVFILSWIVQLYGHYVEGRRPAFIQDLSTLPLGLVLIYFKNTKLNRHSSQ